MSSVLSKITAGIRNPPKALRLVSEQLGSRLDIGTHVYNRDWDLLIVLDACRYDLFTEFAPQHSVYDLFNTVESIYSVGGTTTEWLDKSFQRAPDEFLNDVHYVSCTIFINDFDTDRFHGVDHVYEWGLDPKFKQTRPEHITNETIRAARTSDAGRIVAHYGQPHAPFFSANGKFDSAGDGSGGTQNVWWGLRDGLFDREEIWDHYGENLLVVLDEVKTLIENTEGKVVVTSDHGNAMGSFGVYGHPKGQLHPKVRYVPWAVAEGQGGNDYKLKSRDEMETGASLQRDELLQNLGYKV